LDFGTGTAMFVAVIGAIGLGSAELVRRSDLRRLEQFATVIDHVSVKSAQRAELQIEIDRLALRVTLKRRRPTCAVLGAVGLMATLVTLYIFVRVVLDLVLSVLDPKHSAADLTWQFLVAYVVTLAALLGRRAIRSTWFDSEYRRISSEPEPTRSWRNIFTS
jgi:hypothetical protein